jgi:hypothetical protein
MDIETTVEKHILSHIAHNPSLAATETTVGPTFYRLTSKVRRGVVNFDLTLKSSRDKSRWQLSHAHAILSHPRAIEKIVAELRKAEQRWAHINAGLKTSP